MVKPKKSTRSYKAARRSHSPAPATPIPTVPEYLSTREARAQEAIALARDINKLHDRFDRLVDATPEGEHDGVLEDEARPLFGPLSVELWNLARHRTIVADALEPELVASAPPAGEGARHA